ncbi:MAG TPA: cupin domain-containing protein [Planctomycetota bacterium]|nr:cupin domain-containing protein [Planctomycetota bacterium]
MNVKNVKDVPGIDMGPELPGVTLQVLVGPDDGAENFVLRRFTLEPGAATPSHRHDWEHEIVVTEGEGVLVAADGEHPMKPGNVIYIAPGDLHQFRNTGTGLYRMICLVPMKGHG